MSVHNHFYTMKEAALKAGVAKTTIQRHVNAGKLSALKDEQGRKRIDPAEFHRVYPAKTEQGTDAQSDADQPETDAPHRSASPDASDAHHNTADAFALVREMVASVDKANAEEVRRLEETIEDLRDRLDKESAQNRALTAMITDQSKPEPEPEKTAVFWDDESLRVGDADRCT